MTAFTSPATQNTSKLAARTLAHSSTVRSAELKIPCIGGRWVQASCSGTHVAMARSATRLPVIMSTDIGSTRQAKKPESSASPGRRGIGADGVDALLHWHRLAGQHGLFNTQILDRYQTQTSRNAIARDEEYQVVRHQVSGVVFAPADGANYRSLQRQHRTNGIERGLGSAFLDESDDCLDHHCGEQHTRIDPMMQEGRDDGDPSIT